MAQNALFKSAMLHPLAPVCKITKTKSIPTTYGFIWEWPWGSLKRDAGRPPWSGLTVQSHRLQLFPSCTFLLNPPQWWRCMTLPPPEGTGVWLCRFKASNCSMYGCLCWWSRPPQEKKNAYEFFPKQFIPQLLWGWHTHLCPQPFFPS